MKISDIKYIAGEVFAYFNGYTDLGWRGINYVGDTVIEPSSRWRFGGKRSRKLRQRGKKDCTRGWNVGGGEGAACRSSSSPPINTSLPPRCTDTIRGYHRFPVFSRSRKYKSLVEITQDTMIPPWTLRFYTQIISRCCRVDRRISDLFVFVHEKAFENSV